MISSTNGLMYFFRATSPGGDVAYYDPGNYTRLLSFERCHREWTLRIVSRETIHLLASFINQNQKINTIVGNGKRFMAYEIIKRLKENKEHNILEKLAEDVSAKRKSNNKIHEVWELSFDWKECNSKKFIDQKLDYIHNNPCKGKWNLCTTLQFMNTARQDFI